MRKINRLLILFSIFIIVILLPFKSYALSGDNGEINKLADKDRIKIEKFIEEKMKKGKIAGMSVAIVKGDKTIFQKGYGYGDIENKRPVTPKTLFEIGSNSKSFTGLAILNLEKNGLIKLDAPVTKYIPWLNMKYQGKDAVVTVGDLLYQTSGIPFKTIDKISTSNGDDALEQTVRTLINVDLESKPGERFKYATLNYDVLGLIIEKVIGVTYEEYMEENIIKPMGLNNTYLYKNETITKNMAKGYKIEFLKPRVYDSPIYKGYIPSGQIISNAEDIAKWLKIQMEALEVNNFSKELIEKSHKPRAEDLSTGSSYAAGWYVREKDDNDVYIYHAGENPNYSSFIVYNPEKEIGVAVLSNISSSYTMLVADGINAKLQGIDYNIDIMDSRKTADIIFTLITFITSVILLITLYFILKTFRQIQRKERKYHKKDMIGILKTTFSLIFVILLSYLLYLIPYIFMGFSWKSVYIWFPKSVRFALYFSYITIWGVYIYLLIRSFYKKIIKTEIEETSNL